MQYKNSQSTILSCRHISKKFDQLEILKGITFTVSKGEKIGLVGPNGSGKTTLLKIIADLVKEDDGVITHAKKCGIEYFPQIHDDIDKLSGGERAKKVLATIMSSDAGLFLLDEPTNNLDSEGLVMLENFISKTPKACIIISHDRMFLDNAVNKIIELDPASKSSLVYNGNYSIFQREREERIARQWQQYSDKIEKIEKFNTSLDQRLSWMKKIEQVRKGSRYLPMHEKEKPVAAILRDKEARAGRRARIMKNRFKKYKEDSTAIEKPIQQLPLHILFNSERGSTKVFLLKKVTKAVGAKKIGPINLSIDYGDRWHVIGKNGIGKTTVLKLLLGEIKSDSGTIERGEKVKVGYVSQERWSTASSKTVLEDFLSITKLSETNARKTLNRFRITAEDVKKPVSALSPGEYSRLVIAELVALSPNCIILDEPSNHLDLEALEELEKALKEYKGTLIVVSHDRYFVEKINLDKTFNLEAYSKNK